MEGERDRRWGTGGRGRVGGAKVRGWLWGWGSQVKKWSRWGGGGRPSELEVGFDGEEWAMKMRVGFKLLPELFELGDDKSI